MSYPEIAPELNSLEARVAELELCLKEAVALIDDDDYIPDSFTTQPWREALKKGEA